MAKKSIQEQIADAEHQMEIWSNREKRLANREKYLRGAKDRKRTHRLIQYARYESGKPTIFTTNLSLQDLMNPQDIAHKRIYDRVLEMTIPIQFTGPNVRPKIHQRKMNIFRRILKGGQ